MPKKHKQFQPSVAYFNEGKVKSIYLNKNIKPVPARKKPNYDSEGVRRQRLREEQALLGHPHAEYSPIKARINASLDQIDRPGVFHARHPSIVREEQEHLNEPNIPLFGQTNGGFSSDTGEKE